MPAPQLQPLDPFALAPRSVRPRNVCGIVGLCMVAAATILSPTGFLGMTLCLLVPLGFGGLAVCAVSLAWKPRWPGVAGLTIGILCVGGWVIFFLTIYRTVNADAARFGMTIGQHTRMSMTAISLVERAERLRLPDGGPPVSFDLTTVPLEDQNDPWGRPYRYMLAPTPRGYTFLSNGPDGQADTGDDIDLLTIQTRGTFPLPPISTPASPTPTPASGTPPLAPLTDDGTAVAPANNSTGRESPDR